MMIIMMIMNIEYIWLNKKMKQILQCKIISVIFEVVCFYQFGMEFLFRPFAGVVALLAGKRFLAGV